MYARSKALLVEYHFEYGTPIRIGKRGLNQQLLGELDTLMQELGMAPQRSRQKPGDPTSARLSFTALRDKLTLFENEYDEQLTLKLADQRDASGVALAIQYQPSCHCYVGAVDPSVVPDSGREPSRYVDVDAVVWGLIEAHKQLRSKTS